MNWLTFGSYAFEVIVSFYLEKKTIEKNLLLCRTEVQLDNAMLIVE